MVVRHLGPASNVYHDNNNGNETHGDAGNDRIYGHGGGDLLFGDAGDDWLFGQEGSDTLNGGMGNDRLDGGGGPLDTAVYWNNDQYADCSAEPTSGIDVDLNLASGQVINDGFGSTDTLVGIEKIVATDLSDSLIGNASDNLFTTRAGSDFVAGNSGNDIINGNHGNDSLHGGQGDDWVDGGNGVDWISAGYGNDRIKTGAGNDFVNYDLSLTFSSSDQSYDRGHDVVLDFQQGLDTLHADLVDGGGGPLYGNALFAYLDTDASGELDGSDLYASIQTVDGQASTVIDFGALQADLADPEGIWGAGVATLTLVGVTGINATDFS